eukprot:tig00020603_g11773.t1
MKLAKEALVSLLTQAGSIISVTDDDGDRESVIGVAVNAALMVTDVMEMVLGSSKQNPARAITRFEDKDGAIQSLLGPLLQAVASVDVQAMSAVSVLAGVSVRTSSKRVQASLASLLRELLKGLDPCTDFAEVRDLIMGAADAFVGSGNWAAEEGSESEIFRIIDELLNEFSMQSLGCSICGTQATRASMSRITLAFGRVCFSADADSTIVTVGSAGYKIDTELPKEVRDLGKEYIGDVADSLPFKLTGYLRSPYVEKNNTAKAFNLSTGVLNVETPGVPVKDLKRGITFRFQMPNGTTPVLPLDLVFYNTSSGEWQTCSNVSLTHDKGGSGWTATGVCDHLTPFAIAAPPPVVLATVPIGGSVSDYQNAPPSLAGGVNVAAAVAIPVVLGAAAALAACACFAVAAARRRRRREKQDRPALGMAPSSGDLQRRSSIFKGLSQSRRASVPGHPVAAHEVQVYFDAANANRGRSSSLPAQSGQPPLQPPRNTKSPLHIFI